MIANKKIPTKADWGDYASDYDLIDLYNLFYGKRVEDVYTYFKDYAYISRADELLYVDRRVFQYYIYAFALYLLSDIGKNDTEAKEVFLRLLVDKEKKDPNSVCEILSSIFDLDYSESNNMKKISISLNTIIDQIESEYINGNIDQEIYEEIPFLVKEIKNKCNRFSTFAPKCPKFP